MPSIPLTCVCMRCRSSLAPTAVLHSYALLVCCQHRRPAFVRVAEPRWYTLLSYIRTCCASAAITASYIRMCSSSAVKIVNLCSYVLQNLVATHCCPRFVRAARLPSTSSTCVRTCCKTSFLPTAVLHSNLLRVCRHCRWLHSYALLVYQQHRWPAFVCCRTSLIPTAVLHSYTLLVYRRHCRPGFLRVG